MRVCVNISARQFMQPNFLTSVREALQETGLEPRYLCLEITESTAIFNIDYSKEMLHELMDLGVCVSMDDFGTGYSSLALLKRLQLNEIKIDRSFIRDIHADKGDAAIVEAVIHMSHRLGIGIVAEGVETGQQMDLLEKQGCDVIQGYWFSQPLPPEQLETHFLAEKISF